MHPLSMKDSDVLAQLIAANPSIEEMDITQGHFHQVEAFEPGDILPPTLAKLQSFTLHGLSFSLTGDDHLIHPTPVRNLRHVKILSLYSQYKLDALWTSMRAAGTSLETLILNKYHLRLPTSYLH